MKRRLWMVLVAMSLIAGNGLTVLAASQTTDDSIVMESEGTALATTTWDSNIYGNTIGNIINGGLFLEDETYYYLYHGYDNCVYKTDKGTGASTQLGSTPLFCLNIINGKLYGSTETQTGGSIVEIDLGSGIEKVIRKGSVDKLLAVNQELYYIDSVDTSLRKLDLSTMQETILLTRSVYTMVVYGDSIYFTIEYDGGSLYSMPKDGGELKKLNNVISYMPTVYQDRIYYLALEGNAYTIRSMGLDGSGENILCNMDAVYMNLYGDKLFFINNNARNELYYMDLSSATPIPVRFDVSASLEEAVKRYAVVSPNTYQVTSYKAVNFGQSHMFLMCDEVIDGKEFDDVYIYDFTTGEAMPIAYFCVDAAELGKGLERAAQQSKPAKYTAEEAVAIYRSIMEANGIIWDPTLKDNWDETIGLRPIMEFYLEEAYRGASWGTGFLSMNDPEFHANMSVEAYHRGDTAGNPWERYYLEVTGTDTFYGEPVVCIVQWH